MNAETQGPIAQIGRRQLIAKTPQDLGLFAGCEMFPWQDVVDAAQKLGLQLACGLDVYGNSEGGRMNDRPNIHAPAGISIFINEAGRTVIFFRKGQEAFGPTELIFFRKKP